MCGINSLIYWDKSKKVESEQIEQMNTILRHRGPDGKGVFIQDNVGLGHVRLAIIDPKLGGQPFFSPDGNYVLIFNGEIYNYVELREQLRQRGYVFKTSSDTEVLLNMYIEYKEKCLEQLNGMFAFVIYNMLERTVFVVRDRIGVKPLYYYKDAEQIIITSEIKSMLKTKMVRPQIDYAGLLDYLYFQFPLGDKTLFKDIKQLEPAKYMLIDLDRKEVEIKTYWQVNYDIQHDWPIEEYNAKIVQLLQDAVKLEMRSDVPVGCHLSGGIDSSAVSAFASALAPMKLNSFTGTFRDYSGYDETDYAKLVAVKNDITYNEIEIGAEDFKKYMPQIIYHLDYPVVGPGVFSQYMVNKLIHEHKIKVALGGQGGDELFGGYARYIIAYLEQCLKGSIYDSTDQHNYIVTLQSIIPNLPMLQNYVPILKNFWSRNLFEPMDQRYFDLICRMEDVDKMINFSIEYDPKKEFMNSFHDAQSKSYIDKMTHFDIKTMLLGLLQVEDRVSMAWSIESRVPLLDHRIVEFAATIPPATKFKDGKTKLLLKEALRGVLPEEVINRKDKMGFPVPINEWFKTELKEWVNELLLSENTRIYTIIKKEYVAAKMNTKHSFSRELWGLICLELWMREFFD